MKILHLLLPCLLCLPWFTRAAAPNCSCLVNWTSLDDQMTWDIEVNTTGTCDVEILCTCPVADAGSTIELDFNGAKPDRPGRARLEPAALHQSRRHGPSGWGIEDARIPPALPRPAPPRPDAPRNGRGPLTLRAVKIPGHHVMDMRQLNLTLQK